MVGNYRNRTELRKKPRQPFHYHARILLDDKTPPIACAISDVSETGARLSLASARELPDTFTLLLAANGRPHRHCRVVWRDGVHLGVQFPDQQM